MNFANRTELETRSRSGAKVVVHRDTGLCRVLDKLKMYVDMNDQGIVPHLLLDGFWESWVTIAMRSLVRPGARVVNVGANFGYFALFFAELVGEHGKVIAVEPQESVASLLERSIDVNGFADRVKLFKCAAGAQNGVAQVVLDDERYKNASVRYSEYAPPDRTDYVRSKTLDAICVEAWGTEDMPDVVFIDAEGAEPEVWRGMKLSKTKPGFTMVMEFSPDRYADAFGFAQELAQEFTMGSILETGHIVPTSINSIVHRTDGKPFEMVVMQRKS